MNRYQCLSAARAAVEDREEKYGDPTHLDSWVDKAGYPALGAEVVSK